MRTITATLAALAFTLTACGGSDSKGPTEPAQAQTILAVTITTSSIVSGTSEQAVANMVTGANSSAATNVQWTSSNSDVAKVDGNGLVTGSRAGSAVIRATSGGKTGTVTVSVLPGAAVKVVVYIGDGQSAVAGSGLSEPLCTNVLDAANNRIIGALVTYTVTTGRGQIIGASEASTDGAGISTSGTWILGPDVGVQTVTATSAGATPIVFSAIAK